MTKPAHTNSSTGDYGDLFSRYYRSLCYFASRYAGGGAEDTVQEVFANTIALRGEWDSDASCATICSGGCATPV